MDSERAGEAAPQPAFNAPFRSGIMTVEPEWIDYNGHLNMAYYNVLFDRCVDQAYAPLGLDETYVRDRNASFFTAETHLCYLRELHERAPVYATFQLLDFDAKRIHGFQELYHAEEGWLSATCEVMSLHVDTLHKRVAPWPDDVMERLGAMKAAHAGLAAPSRAGRRIAIPRTGR